MSAARGSTKRQAMFRLMVSEPGLLREVYDRWVADLVATGEDVPTFDAFAEAAAAVAASAGVD